MEVACIGQQITVNLNGTEILAKKVDRLLPRGRIAIFGYCSQGRVDYRNIRIRELRSDPTQ